MTNKKYICPSKEEHEAISDFLKEHFFAYLDRCLERHNISKVDCIFYKKYINAISTSFDETQGNLGDALNLSSISVKTKQFNNLLAEFSDEKGIDITPPIQLFFDHLDSKRKKKRLGCHLACSKGMIPPGYREYYCSFEISTLANAMMHAKPSCDLPAMITSIDEIIQDTTLVDAIQDVQSKSSCKTLYFSHPQKYFRPMKDVLRWDSREQAKWFRKTGPIACDFRDNKVWRRNVELKDLRDMIDQHKITILEGKSASGKSVLIRQLAYDLLENDTTANIYLYCYKTDPPIIDYANLRDALLCMNGLIIIEDMHMGAYLLQSIIEDLYRIKCKILFTARPPFKANIASNRSNLMLNLPTIKISSKSAVEDIIKHYVTSNHIDHNIPSPIAKVHDLSKDNLWLTSYALLGYNIKIDSSQWTKGGVLDDLKDIENPDGMNCNPEILIVLSPFSVNDFMVHQTFLIKSLGYKRNDIRKLIRYGEIVEFRHLDKVYLSLPHSSLAKAYWKHGTIYRRELKYTEATELFVAYMKSEVPNGFYLNIFSTEIYQSAMIQLDIDNYLLSIINSDNSLNVLHEWIRQYEHYRNLNEKEADALAKRINDHSDILFATSRLLSFFNRWNTDLVYTSINKEKLKFALNKPNNITTFSTFISKLVKCNEKYVVDAMSLIASDSMNSYCSLLENTSDIRGAIETISIFCQYDKSKVSLICNNLNFKVISDRMIEEDVGSICNYLAALFLGDEEVGWLFWEKVREYISAKINEKNDDEGAYNISNAILSFCGYDLLIRFVEDLLDENDGCYSVKWNKALDELVDYITIENLYYHIMHSRSLWGIELLSIISLFNQDKVLELFSSKLNEAQLTNLLRDVHNEAECDMDAATALCILNNYCPMYNNYIEYINIKGLASELCHAVYTTGTIIRFMYETDRNISKKVYAHLDIDRLAANLKERLESTKESPCFIETNKRNVETILEAIKLTNIDIFTKIQLKLK